MGFKQAAEELLKIADDLERDAAGVTQFVCDSCNHTASLAKINGMRRQAADESAASEGNAIIVADVGVNDKIQCPACDGVMAYRATEASAPYYFDDKAAAKHKEPDGDEGPNPTKPSDNDGDETPGAQPQTPVQTPAPVAGPTASKKLDYDSLRRYAARK